MLIDSMVIKKMSVPQKKILQSEQYLNISYGMAHKSSESFFYRGWNEL